MDRKKSLAQDEVFEKYRKPSLREQRLESMNTVVQNNTNQKVASSICKASGVGFKYIRN